MKTDDGKDGMVAEDVVKEKDGERDARRLRNLMKLYAHTAYLFECSLNYLLPACFAIRICY